MHEIVGLRKQLFPVRDSSTMSVGKYVVYRDSHFMGLEVWGDGTFILRPTRRTHIGAVGDWHLAVAKPFEAIFQLGSAREGEVIGKDCLGGAHCETLTFQSAFSGEALHSIPVSELNSCRNFVAEGRRLLSAQLGHPPLAISLLTDGEPLAVDLTWQDLGRPLEVEVLVQRPARSLARTLMQGVKANDASAVLACLRRGQCPDTRYSTGWTALPFAAYQGFTDVADILLHGGANVDLADGDGETPLAIAAHRGHFSTVATLLARGADPNARTPTGGRIVHDVVVNPRAPQYPLLPLLLEYGADLTLKDQDGDGVFVVAAPGCAMAYILPHVWCHLAWTDVLCRYLLEASAWFHPMPRLFLACKTLHRRLTYFHMDVARGGGEALPSLMNDLPFFEDVRGGSSSSPVPVMAKEPHVWLRLCQNRAVALQKKQADEDSSRAETIQYSEVGYKK